MLVGFTKFSVFHLVACIYGCRYTWQIYSERLMTLAGVYGFWKYVSNLDRRETRRYLEMFYALKYRKLVSSFAPKPCMPVCLEVCLADTLIIPSATKTLFFPYVCESGRSSSVGCGSVDGFSAANNN